MTSGDAILARAMQRHGGVERWRRLDSITLTVERLGGPLPWRKGVGRIWPMPSRVRVMPHRQRVEFDDYPTPGVAGVYERGRVWLDGIPTAEGSHRHGMRRTLWSRWSAADALYFFGYALTTYLGAPFMLDDCEVIAGATRRDGMSWRVVRFPDGFETHSPVQRFWFAADGLIVRHDYHAEVLGPLAYGAHYSRDYTEVDGWPIARARAVDLGLGRFPRIVRTPMPVLRARLAPLAVRFTDGITADGITADGGSDG